MTKETSAAVVTIKDAPAMTARRRKAIALWLRRQATFIEKHGHQCASRFTARYMDR